MTSTNPTLSHLLTYKLRHSSRELFCSRMEGFFSEKPNTYSEQIDLTLKLSPCGQNAEEKMVLTRSSSSVVGEKAQESPFVLCLAEAEKGLVRFGDLQTMRRVRTGKTFLLKKMRRAAAAQAQKFLPVSPPAARPPPHEIHNNLKMFANLSRDSWHNGGGSSNVQTLPKQVMTLWPSERAAKKLKHVNLYEKSDIAREMGSVITSGDGSSGKRIEGVLYKYKRDQVCSFLSPTEFVMHAGGKEVADPMKHITLCSDSF